MKFTLKVVLLGLFFSFICMLSIHYFIQSHTKNIYVCQVGIYAITENKDNKVSQLLQDGYTSYTYMNNNQYYVLSMISENLNEVENNANELNGIIKTYCVNENVTYEDLLVKLEEGDIE